MQHQKGVPFYKLNRKLIRLPFAPCLLSEISCGGDFNPKHKISTPNSDETENHYTTLENSRSITEASRSSLDEDLYGTSEAYNKNLEYLREKLRFLDLNKIPEVPNVNRDNYVRTSSNSSSSFYEGTSRSSAQKQQACLSTKETFINLLEPFGNGNFTSKTNCNKPILTLYKAPTTMTTNLETLHTYKVPNKNWTRSEKIDSVTNASGDCNLCTFNKRSLSNSSVDELGSRFSSATELNQSFDSASTNKSYVVSFKRRNRKDAFHFLKKLSYNQQSNLTTKNVGVFVSSRRFTQRSKSDSLIRSETTDYDLNLPSSIAGDLTTSNKSSPLEPKIIIIDTTNVKKKSKAKRNRIAPSTSSDTTYKSSVKKTKSELSTEKEKQAALFRKYYEDTPEITSNPHSTPSFRISIAKSQSSLNFQSSSKDSGRSIEETVGSSDTSSAKSKNLEELTIFNPLLTASLDVPRIFTRKYIFPAVSQMTGWNKGFVHRRCFDDWDLENYEIEELKFESESCFKSVGRMLLDSPGVSPQRKENKGFNEDVESMLPITSRSKEKSSLRRCGSIRKLQSTEFIFYAGSSSDAHDERESFSKNKSSHSEAITELDEIYTGCFCCEVFFPKRKRFFS